MIYDAIKNLVKPETIWRLKYGQIVMVLNVFREPMNDKFMVNVLNERENKQDIQYLEAFYEATLIG